MSRGDTRVRDGTTKKIQEAVTDESGIHHILWEGTGVLPGRNAWEGGGFSGQESWAGCVLIQLYISVR